MNEIFSAIYARLTSEIAFPVYDHVPQDSTEYPFVRIDPIQTDNDDTVNKNGFTATLQIIGYSRYRGLKEINDLSDGIYNALHHWEMPNTATYAVGNLIQALRQVINLQDGITRNSIQRFNFFIEPL